MLSSISFILDGNIVSLDFDGPSRIRPTTTVLNYLRSLPTHRGVKEGCAEGDCGACTVVLGELGTDGTLRYRSVDSCLVFLPMIHGKQLITVENLKSSNGHLHPVQEAMVEAGGSQCGFCTPGIIMSLFALFKNSNHPSRVEVDDALTGNLCRCTGYKPIIEAAAKACVHNGVDGLTDSEPHVIELLKTIPFGHLALKTTAQQYLRPATLTEALALKHRYPGATVICGATDVALRVTKQNELIPLIIDLSAVDELKIVLDDDKSMTIGSAVTFSELTPRIKDCFGALYDMIAVFGSQQIRNLATLGGNLGTASPIGDSLPVLIAYNARVVLQNMTSTREVPLDNFFKGYRESDRRADELITSVIIPRVQDGVYVKSYKISKRKDLDISTLSGGFRLHVNEHTNDVEAISLVYGGMADVVKHARTTEQFLLGKKWERGVIEQAMLLLSNDFSPISDTRGGAQFRRIAARNLLLKFWSETVAGEKEHTAVE
jgi:xanthine dehydrogenase small subunit